MFRFVLSDKEITKGCCCYHM